jgi:hypothetical protein
MTDSGPMGNENDHGAMPETGADLNPKGQYTYHWEVPERAGPGPSDADSVVWLYHAHDVDREFVALFMIFDENLSPYLGANIGRFTPRRTRSGRKTASSRRATRNTPSTDCSMAISVASPFVAASGPDRT